MVSIKNIKQRFRIIGNDPLLDRAIEKAQKVAYTDISVLVIGESGVGKEFIPRIIHQISRRKHNAFIAVNCGAIPEGTIESELFGHEKGAFTGASNVRKGYFEVADKGTIFLDEVGELPLATQVRLLRILETGEFLKVGSSNIQKTNVRIIAATNINLANAIRNSKFREDLYYRLNTVQINLPPLRHRRGDIYLLFEKFSQYFAEKYNMPATILNSSAIDYLENYNWPGNIRQLKNCAEQLSVVETEREISLEKLIEYLPDNGPFLQKVIKGNNEIDLFYKVFYDLRKDLCDLKSLILELIRFNTKTINKSLYSKNCAEHFFLKKYHPMKKLDDNEHLFRLELKNNESLSLQEKEIEFIKKALFRNNGKRKVAARELGISERTLYRKIKQYGL